MSKTLTRVCVCWANDLCPAIPILTRQHQQVIDSTRRWLVFWISKLRPLIMCHLAWHVGFVRSFWHPTICVGLFFIIFSRSLTLHSFSTHKHTATYSRCQILNLEKQNTRNIEAYKNTGIECPHVCWNVWHIH